MENRSHCHGRTSYTFVDSIPYECIVSSVVEILRKLVNRKGDRAKKHMEDLMRVDFARFLTEKKLKMLQCQEEKGEPYKFISTLYVFTPDELEEFVRKIKEQKEEG